MVKNMSAVDDKVRDLKMQVQEELIRNEKMEKVNGPSRYSFITRQ